MLSLYIACRSLGVRWPLSDEDDVEVWQAPGSTLVFVLSGAVMRALVQQHLDSLERQAGAARAVDHTARVRAARRPRVERTATGAEPPARRASRRSRRRRPAA